jgi:hypothetical protein
MPAGSAGDPNMLGGSASVAFYFNHYFGVVGDFGGYNFTGQPKGFSEQIYTIMFGPRFTFRKDRRYSPFAQALFGGGRVIINEGAPQGGESSFVAIFGGGLDIRVSRHFAIRAVQIDYVMTHFANTSVSPSIPATQNDFRVSAGIVFRPGRR